jgi:hypothetical protein
VVVRLGDAVQQVDPGPHLEGDPQEIERGARRLVEMQLHDLGNHSVINNRRGTTRGSAPKARAVRAPELPTVSTLTRSRMIGRSPPMLSAFGSSHGPTGVSLRADMPTNEPPSAPPTCSVMSSGHAPYAMPAPVALFAAAGYVAICDQFTASVD